MKSEKRWEDIDSVKARVTFLEQQIAELKRAEEAAREEKERAEITLQSIGDAVITTDEKGNIEYLNVVAEDLTGWNVDEAIGMEISEMFIVINEVTNMTKDNPAERCLSEGRVIKCTNNTILVHRDGHRFAIEASAAPIKNREGEIVGCILVFRDVTEKRRLLQQMAHQATHDPLTGLANRMLFNDRLKKALEQVSQTNKMLAVMLIDLDRFKNINDACGHSGKERIVIQVAERIKGVIPKGDTVARLGGDEFAVLISTMDDVDDAAEVAREIVKAFGKPFQGCDYEIFITASIGIAVYPSDGLDAPTIMKHADTAMYRAKEMGGNKFRLFTPALNEKVSRKMRLEAGLRRAIERNEFVMYYQPKVNAETWQVTGFEALVRWNHPEKGVVSPGEFIPLAEETGLIVPLGKWILKEVCQQINRWMKMGLKWVPPVAINLSAQQFHQKGLVEEVSNIIGETGVAPSSIQFEITETAVVNKVGHTISTLQRLREIGFKIALDDFGIGYSSLNYLKQFPLDALKIDRAFIWEIAKNVKDAAIVSSIIALAKNLNLTVIAEGVESGEQVRILKKQKCFEMQGYFFSKPLLVQEISRWMREHGLFPKLPRRGWNSMSVREV